MAYNFAQYANGINLYFIIDMVILVTVFAIMLSFFVYKRNMKVFFLLLLGAVLDVLVNVLSELLGGAVLAISKYVMHFVVIFDIVAACVVYQNDLKNLFQKVSTAKGFETHNSDDELRDATAEILTACQDMAKQDVGAIIIIDSAGDIHDNILDTGTRLNATLSAPLFESIFNTKAPLHDGAVIVRGNKIIAAGCFLTLTQRNVNKEMGTRHRAAIGITEDTDVLSIVVSEETGIISVVKHGEIKRYMTMDKLKDEIEEAYGISPTAIALREAHANRKIGGWDEGFDPFYGAPVILIVLADKACNTYIYDGSLVMGNMMLAAHSLGLGSIWIHRAKEEFELPEWKQLLSDLGVSGEWEGIGHCAVGYADCDLPKAAERKDGRVIWVK